MVSSKLAAASSAFALLAIHISQATAQSAGPITSEGCYSSATGLTSQGSAQYQTQGLCQQTCLGLQMPVMGLTGGSDCWCGSELPPSSDKVDSSLCSHQCNGYTQPCGGELGTFGIYLTGLSTNVGVAQGDSSSSSASSQPSSTSSSSSSSSTSSASSSSTSSTESKSSSATPTTLPPSVVTVSGGTSVVTIPGSTITQGNAQNDGSSNQSPQPTQSGGTSTGAKVGIAVGVIAGVAAIAALVAAVVFYLKKKKDNDVVGRHRRNTSTNAFASDGTSTSIDGTRTGSMSDSRLDPTMVEREKRMSNGSVFADNEDYSRRILKVTNPSDN